MPTLMPWTTVEIGDVDIFSPALPSLVVYTWYVDDEPESSVVYFWRDENTGIVHHELAFVGPEPLRRPWPRQKKRRLSAALSEFTSSMQGRRISQTPKPSQRARRKENQSRKLVSRSRRN